MRILLISLLSLLFTVSYSQIDLTYYLPSGVEFNEAIPKPKDVIRHEVGEWHISHDKLVQYMYALADASDRVTIEEIGETYESRPLLNLIITSPSNHANLGKIKADHLKLSNPELSNSLDIANMPAVAYIGYSIHGNESSGSNAALLVAYYLTAGRSKELSKILDETIIILDPSYNPDGLTRFSSFVNANKSYNNYSDPNGRELNEPWPGGRTNHYWFDMNRDWLFVQLPESRARINRFQEWKPNLLTDHHEMGSNNTFFFQPGIPSRNNPNTPKEVYRLTQELGKYHAAVLDSIGSLYYTQESFDDYYFGKGSTYPDLNGTVGILFEQASSRGHVRETSNGLLTFPFTIKNQFNTSLSSLRGLNKMRLEFLEHQCIFYKNALSAAKSDPDKAIVFASKDKSRNYHLAEILWRHDIEIFQSNEAVSINNKNYEKTESYIVPLQNEKYELIKTIFDTNKKFQDSLFYDVSTWTLPLSFNVDYKSIGSKQLKTLGKAFDPAHKPKGLVSSKSDYAYMFTLDDYYTPKVLNELLQNGFKLKVAHHEFKAADMTFKKGSILIAVKMQKWEADIIYDKLKYLAAHTGVNFYGLSSGLSYESVSLGSPQFELIQKPKIAMLVGDGIRSYNAGEVWHLFDQRYDIKMAMLPTDDLNRISLDKYNTLILVDGSYSGLSPAFSENLKSWVKNGGTIISAQGALKYLNKVGLGKFEFKKNTLLDSSKANYEEIRNFSGAQQIGGAIFQTAIDTSNPLFYGLDSNLLPVFRNTEDFLVPASGKYSNPMTYTSEPLLSGYISEENLELLKNSSALGISSYGKGKVIGFTDNLNFRAIWYGTNKVFMNAIFFGNMLNRAADR